MVKNKLLSVIIPIYNEAPTIEETLKRLKNLKLTRIDKEVIIVDDGSTDNLDQKLKKLKKGLSGFKSFKILSHSVNQGKGAAIRTALKQVKGDYFIIQDADLEYDPQDIPLLLEPIEDGKAAVVYGSRFTGEHRNMFFWHMMGNKFLTLLTNVLYNTTLSDMEVGYKLFKKEALKGIKLSANRFDFEPEVTTKLLKKGIRIYEVPISYAGREYHQGKKITWRDGLRAIWVILRERF